MGYYSDDPYDSPDKFGLEIVLEVEKEPNYDFHMLVVWRQLDSGLLFWAEDAGCSCPSPFEDFKSITDLNKVESAQQLHDKLDEMAYSHTYGYLPDGSWGPTGERVVGWNWTEARIADAHAKIAQLQIPKVIQGTLAHQELEAA